VVIPKPAYWQRVRALAELQWREPVTVVYLGEVKPEFDVPGRRKDGTVLGTHQVRRFFWNAIRGTVGGVVSVALSLGSGTAGHVFGRDGRVIGGENAQALGLVDAAKSADGAWLVYSPSHVGVIDTGPTFYDPADRPPPEFLWQAAYPDAPKVFPRKHHLLWSDGSELHYIVAATEPEARA
jgi:hypothetical protein